jgi:hypothetical protein
MNAAQRFFAVAMRDYGVPEGEHVRIPMRQCELAQRQGVAASTVGAYLTTMGDAVVVRWPHIVLRAAGDPDRPEPAIENPSAESPLRELLAAISALVAGQAVLLRAIAQALDAFENLPVPADWTRGNDAGSREFLADPVQEEEKKNPPLPAQLLTRGVREEATEYPRDAARIANLLSPLHELVEQRGLVPLHDLAPIAAAIATYDDAAVCEMVDAIVREASAGGSVVRSPFGLLVSRARAATGIATRGATPREPAAAHKAASSVAAVAELEASIETDVDPSGGSSDGVFEMLRTLEENHRCDDLLRSLDDAIARDFAPRTRRLLSSNSVRALRAEYFRERGSAATEDARWSVPSA